MNTLALGLIFLFLGLLALPADGFVFWLERLDGGSFMHRLPRPKSKVGRVFYWLGVFLIYFPGWYTALGRLLWDRFDGKQCYARAVELFSRDPSEWPALVGGMFWLWLDGRAHRVFDRPGEITTRQPRPTKPTLRERLAGVTLPSPKKLALIGAIVFTVIALIGAGAFRIWPELFADVFFGASVAISILLGLIAAGIVAPHWVRLARKVGKANAMYSSPFLAWICTAGAVMWLIEYFIKPWFPHIWGNVLYLLVFVLAIEGAVVFGFVFVVALIMLVFRGFSVYIMAFRLWLAKGDTSVLPGDDKNPLAQANLVRNGECWFDDFAMPVRHGVFPIQNTWFPVLHSILGTLFGLEKPGQFLKLIRLSDRPIVEWTAGRGWVAVAEDGETVVGKYDTEPNLKDIPVGATLLDQATHPAHIPYEWIVDTTDAWLGIGGKYVKGKITHLSTAVSPDAVPNFFFWLFGMMLLLFRDQAVDQTAEFSLPMTFAWAWVKGPKGKIIFGEKAVAWTWSEWVDKHTNNSGTKKNVAGAKDRERVYRQQNRKGAWRNTGRR